MIERTRAGLAAAAANGRKGGRPRKVDDADPVKARHFGLYELRRLLPLVTA